MVKQISGTLTITIRKQDENYTIEAIGSKGIKVDPQPAPQLKTLLSDQQITDTLKDLSSQTAPATTDAIQKLGKALYDSLFADRDLLLAFGKVQGSASADSGAHLRLQIEPAELAALPWETLHDGNNWLSAQSTTPLVRKLALSNNRKPLQKLQVRGALRILFVGASPENLDPLKVEETADELETLLGGAIKKKQIVFDKLLNATLEDLQQGLLKDYHILYFAGHGSPEGIFLDDGQGDVIEKEGKVIGRERGDKSLVSAETLAQALKGKQTRLVFLAACETSKASEGSRLLRGFAQELAERSNLPAIVAMQYFISDMQANPLTTQFFAALAAGRPVDMAMAEARSVLMKKGQVSRDVFSPVLYLQAEDGALFPKAKNWPVIVLVVALSIVAIVGGLFYRISEINKAESLAGNSLDLINKPVNKAGEDKDLAAFVLAIKAGKTLQWQHATSPVVLDALLEVLLEGREKNHFQGHDNQVMSVSFSPDGKTLASGSYDRTIKLWNVESGKVSTLEGHTDIVSSVSFSSDGKTLASGSNDKTIKLWDVESGKEIRTLTGDEPVLSVSFSPDGKTLASGSDKGTIKLWDVESGKEIRTLPGYDIHSSVWSVSFSPDGKKLASLSNDGTIKLWNLDTGKEISTLKRLRHDAKDGQEYDANDRSMSFSPDGKTLAYGSDDSNIKLWNLETGTYTQMKHDGPVESVSFSPDGKTLAASSVNGTIKLWYVKTGIEIPTHMKHDLPVRSVSFSPDSKTLASGSADYTIKIWNLEPGIEIPTLTGHRGLVKSVSFSHDGKTLASGSDDYTIKLWNVKTRAEIHTLTGHRGLVKSVSFSPDDKTLASGSYDGKIKLWDVETGKEIRTLQGDDNLVNSMSFSPDGKTLASGSHDGKIKLWDVETGEEIRTLQGLNIGKEVTSVSFSPDGKTLASGKSNERVAGTDNTIQLWDVETGKELHPLKGHNQGVNSVSFSPKDKTLLASGSDDRTIKLWNVETGTEIHILPEHKHNDPVQSVSFSPDGKTLASGSGLVDENFPGTDNTIKLWNVETGKEIRTLPGHNKAVNSVSFSPDGNTLASGSDDGTIKLWHLPDLQVKPLLELSCDWVRAYLENNLYVKEDKDLCKGIVTSQLPEKTQKTITSETTPVPTPKSPDKQPEVKQIDPKAAKEISELKGHQGQVRSVTFSRDGQTLATSGEDGTIRLWNAQGKFLSQFKGNQTAIRSINFSPDGKKLVSDAGGTIRLWDLQGNLLTEFVASQKLLRSVKFNPKNGQQLASTGDDGIIYLWNFQGQSLAKWQADPKRVWDLEFSPDGQQIASAEASGIVSLWNLQGKSLHKFKEHIPNPVLSVAFSPDGKQLVSGCNIGMIRSWSLPNYQIKNTSDDVNNHAEFNSVAYGLDGKLIVSGDNKGYIKMWKVNNQQPSPFWTSPDQNSIIRKVAFSPDGKHFATAADNGIVKLWQLE